MNATKPGRRNEIIAVAVLLCAAVGITAFLARGGSPPAPPPPPPIVKSVDLFRKDWDSTGPHNWPVAEPLAELSEKAYQPPLNAKGAFDLLDFDDSEAITAGSMFAYVVSSTDVMVIAFRGTELGDVGDWIADLDFVPMTTSHGTMPAGFLKGYESICTF